MDRFEIAAKRFLEHYGKIDANSLMDFFGLTIYSFQEIQEKIQKEIISKKIFSLLNGEYQRIRRRYRLRNIINKLDEKPMTIVNLGKRKRPPIRKTLQELDQIRVEFIKEFGEDKL